MTTKELVEQLDTIKQDILMADVKEDDDAQERINTVFGIMAILLPKESRTN